ncbi:MAG: ribonucleotide-diphosphate reductase subunit beta [Hyphomicrobiales bacterium]|nr:ribonucleotide-diphosphate reductase subunit beta [Hyphomicrobiales bacterium]
MPDIEVRKGMPSAKLSRTEFDRRFRARLADPAFDTLQPELDRIADAAWNGYTNARKSPLTRKAGTGFADPYYDVSIDWLNARSAIIIKLFHEWNRETGAPTPAVSDDIVDVAKTMVFLEDRFVALAFDLGPVERMKPADIKSYVRYIADWRLTQLRLPTLFGYFVTVDGAHEQRRPHPLPWIVEILNGVKHANFFEQRATEYSKGATRRPGMRSGRRSTWLEVSGL